MNAYRPSTLRLLLLAIILHTSLSISPLAAQDASDPAGSWEGKIEIPGQSLEVTIELSRGSDGAWKGSIDIPMQNAKGLPLNKIAVKDASVTFAIANIPGDPTFKGSLSADGATISGTFHQGGGTFPFSLTRETGATPAATAALLDSLRKFIPDAMNDFKVPGLAIAIVRKGEVIFSEGFGHRDAEKKLPVTPNTLFAIGSSTKAFTSFVIGTLVDDGKLEWEKPVVEYLPGFKLQDECATSLMTPRDLLTHTSGLPRHDLMWYNSSYTRKEIFERLQYLEPSAEFRGAWQYQNLMYMTAGYLAGDVMGTSWEELVRTRIFTPLAMTRSNFSVRNLDTAADASRGYRIHEKGGKKVVEMIPYRNIDQIGPAGSINSNVIDMAKWVALHLGDGTHEGKRVISEATLKELHAPQVVIGDNTTSRENLFQLYALGWMVEAYRGHRLLHHGGNIDGFTALVTFMPDDDIGMVILTNMNATALPSMVMYTIYDRMLGLSEIDWRGKMKAQMGSLDSVIATMQENENLVRVAGTRPSHDLDDYVGEYENEAYGVIKIEEVRDRLKARYNGLETPLEHFHYDIFSTTGPPEELKGMKLLFQTGMNGDVDRVAVRLEPQVDEIIFKRRGETLDSASLAKYTGEYLLSGMTMTFTMRGGNVLMLSAPGQPPYELIPYREGEFKLKGAEGYSVKFITEKGKVTKATFIQPNGVFVAKRKE